MGRNLSYKPPKKKPRSKKDLIEYLAEHFRYDTMRGWNARTSYARCVKLSYLDFSDKRTRDVAWDVVGSDSDWHRESGISRLIAEFDRRHDYRWQIGFNGRSSGYMVLYAGFQEPSGYRSFCTACGQQNFTAILPTPENPTSADLLTRYIIDHPHWTPITYPSQDAVKALGLSDAEVIETATTLQRLYWNAEGRRMQVSFNNVCGRCGEASRVNYDKTHMKVGVWAGRGVDMDEDFSEWDKHTLSDRAEVVWDFDQTVNACIKAFVKYCTGACVVEQTIMVPQTIRVLQRGKECDDA